MFAFLLFHGGTISAAKMTNSQKIVVSKIAAQKKLGRVGVTRLPDIRRAFGRKFFSSLKQIVTNTIMK